MRVLAVAALKDGDVRVGLVGEDRLEAIPVVVEKDSCAPGCGRSRRTISLEPSGQADRQTLPVISQTSPFLRSEPSFSSALTQVFSGI